MASSGSGEMLVSIKIAASPTRAASERALQQTQETLLLEALDRSLRAQGYRVLAPTGPKPESYQDTTYARTLVGEWSEGPAPDFGVTVSVRMLADEREKNDLYVNHPGLASIVYVLSSTAKPVRFAITLSFEQPAARSTCCCTLSTSYRIHRSPHGHHVRWARNR